jgi:DNA (cytosine-5)-methyltransferase 1
MDLRTAISLLPTPRATRGGPATETVELLPTPRARDGKGRGYEDDLPSTVDRLLPTPAASMPNDGESLESWEARRQRNLAKGINGNGQGTPLAIAVKLLPTPMAGDATGTRNATAGRSNPDSQHHPGWTLSDVVFSGALLPTPTAADGDRESETYGRGNPTLKGALLPTPWASDGTKGGPNQRGSKGDLMLPSAVAQLSSGASTSPPSDAGNESSNAPPRAQLTIWDA